MSSNRLAVFGLFPSRLNFEYAVCELKNAGFKEDDISAVFPPGASLDDGGSAIPEYISAALKGMEENKRGGPLKASPLRSGCPGRESDGKERISNGGVLMLIRCENDAWVTKALESLRSIGAEGICSTRAPEMYSTGDGD